MKKRSLWILLVLVVAGVAAAFLYPRFRSQGKGSDEGDVMEEVGRKDFVSAVLAMGTIKPQVGAEINVGARLSGKVEKLAVRVGDKVKKGDILAMIEHQDLLLQVSQKELQIASLSTQKQAVSKKGAADEEEARALITQRQEQLATERARMESLKTQGEAELAAARRLLDSIRTQGQASVDVAASQIDDARSQHELARKDLERLQPLFEKGMLSARSVDEGKAQEETTHSRLRTTRESLQLARTQLREQVAVQEESIRVRQARFQQDQLLQEQIISEAEASVALAQKALDSLRVGVQTQIQVLEAQEAEAKAQEAEARIKLSYATVTAPIDGIVGTVSTREGETVAAGFNAPTFVTVVDVTRLQVDAFVDEVDIGKVKVGQTATFTVDAFPGRTFEGSVVAIYPTAILLDNVVYYDVVVDIRGLEPGVLRPEMTTSVNIKIETHPQAIAIKSQAIRRNAGKTLVQVKGEAEPREVRTGLEDEEHTEILEGLKEGELVSIPQPRRKKGSPR